MKTIKLIAAAAALALTLGTAGASETPELPKQKWSFDGPFGTFDRDALNRGYQVYREVCASCHGMNLIAFRNLQDIGFAPEQISEFAAGYEVQDGPNDEGEMFMRAARASDRFPSPFPNEQAARFANGGAYPPDLSLITKAREGGAAYIYSLLTGYQNPPASLPKALRPGTGLHYNPYFANLNIAMAKPLSDGQVTYDDGTKASVDQMSKDVSAFLVWTAEPKLVKRVQVGWAVLGFLAIFTVLAYLSYRNIWADKKH